MLKWRTILGVMCVLPPPGGPNAVSIKILSIFINCWSFLLYHPLWSKNCLKSSIGGCALYSYFLGILSSSTKTIYFLPTGAPYTPLLILSNFKSIASWVWFAVVCALKVIGMYWKIYPIPKVKSWFKLIVFPVPVGPVTSTWWLLFNNIRVRYVALWLSAVGTIT